MFKKIKNRVHKKEISKLNVTPGESIRDLMIENGVKAITESAYTTGNATEKLISASEKVGKTVDSAVGLGTSLGAGGESASALGRIAFKATKDAARQDTVCTGLCLVSAGCETVAIGCSVIKFIPFRGKIYVGAKIVSRGCMSYRNLCAGEGC